jgi:hypothetical protein
MICLRTLLRIYEKIPTQKSFKKLKVFSLPEAAHMKKKSVFGA